MIGTDLECRPSPAGRGRGRGPLRSSFASGSGVPSVGGAGRRRSPRDGTTCSTSPPPGPAGVVAAACPGGSAGCRSSAATTPSSPPTLVASLRRAHRVAQRGMRAPRSGMFTAAARWVLSPSPAHRITSLARGGRPGDWVMRWTRGVDTDRFDPAKRDPSGISRRDPRPVRGPSEAISRRASTCYRTRSCRLARAATGGSTSCSRAAARRRRRCKSKLGKHATFLGWLDGEELTRALRQRRPVLVL